MEKELRRNLNTLAVTGAGVIIFGVWGIIKLLLIMLFASESMHRMMGYEGPNEQTMMAVFYVAIITVSTIGLLFRIYIGHAAISESKGNRKHPTYIVLGFLLVLESMISIFYSSITIDFTTPEGLDGFVSIFVEITSLVITIELLVSAIRVRKLRKALEG